MIKFTTTSTQSVHATLIVDGDNDLVLALNGVDVIYVSSENGSLNYVGLTPDEMKTLAESGIVLSGNKIGGIE